MIKPDFPENEAARLFELLSLELLDSDPDPAFDDLVHLASVHCSMPIVLISLIDAERQWFKSKVGLSICELPRSTSFCGHAILGKDIFIINDASKDERFFDNPLVTGPPYIKFYAGVPLINSCGHALGTICLIDHKERILDDEDILYLRRLSRQVLSLIELRKRTLNKLESLKEIKRLTDVIGLQNSKIKYYEKMHVLSEMASGVCHEINNPLAVISLALASMKKMLPTDFKGRESYIRNHERAEGGIERISRIVSALRAFSRIETMVPRTLISLQDIVSETLLLCEEKLKNSGIVLHTEFGNDPVTIYANKSQIVQLLFNLLINSRDAIAGQEEKKWIKISVYQTSDSFVHLRVTDCGPGIPEHLLEKIMLPFFTTKELGRGAGIGLSISDGYARENGGLLIYELNEGHTSFRATFKGVTEALKDLH